jgi:pyridoxine kinase
VVTPNHFELDLLADRTTGALDEVKDAVSAVQARGPGVVMVTSLVTDDTPTMPSTCYPRGRSLLPRAYAQARCRAERRRGRGSCAVLRPLAAYRDAAAALGHAAAAVHGLLARTAQAGSRELLLVAAQDELVSPSQMFDVHEV